MTVQELKLTSPATYYEIYRRGALDTGFQRVLIRHEEQKNAEQKRKNRRLAVAV